MKDAIYDRISVRTYEKKILSQDEKHQVDELISSIKENKGPFGHQINYFVTHQKDVSDEEAKRIGTYGFIKNASSFVGGTITNTLHAMVDYGYLFEELILKLTQCGFATCWLAGTFDRKAFSHYINGDLMIPAITPIGYPEDSMSLRERAIRFAIKANRRNPFKDMFFLCDISHPLHEETDHPLKLAFELVQLGPSASNKQPWRLIVDDSIIHFYLERTPNYGVNRPFVIQALDIGIALKHFEIGLHELKKLFHYMVMEHPNPKTFEYIISIVIDK